MTELWDTVIFAVKVLSWILVVLASLFWGAYFAGQGWRLGYGQPEPKEPVRVLLITKGDIIQYHGESEEEQHGNKL